MSSSMWMMTTTTMERLGLRIVYGQPVLLQRHYFFLVVAEVLEVVVVVWIVSSISSGGRSSGSGVIMYCKVKIR